MQETSPHYTVLARRFRPQTFSEVIGQQHVAQSLQNAIRTGRVAHAYLFTGARGVGKTSTARIFAKALNCPNAVDGVPCNECDICQDVSSGRDMDVLEIDGASNRGIDDIRSLRGNVNVRSMRTKYKLYIIDEVHMLTTPAFNALLKTLEEPPPNVKFVFCTTEPGRVPDTILSRCQRFDFSSILTDSIATRLRQIAEQEGYEVEPEALELVARRASGSMRDSQSLFDQLLAFGESPLTSADVHRLLGTAPDERLIELFAALVERRSADVLHVFDQALTDGVQLNELMDQMLNYTRDLMVVAAGAERLPLASVAENSRASLAGQAGEWGLETIIAGMEILSEAKLRMFRVSYGRAIAELALVRLSRLEDLSDLGQLIEQVRQGVSSSPSSSPTRSSPANSVPRPAARTASHPPESGHTPDSAEKKTAEIAPTPESVTQSEAVSPPESPPRYDFREGSEREFWSYVVEQFTDMARDHLRAVETVAISGPNRLDLTFCAGYDFSKRFVEQPEVMERLTQAVCEATGRDVRIVLHAPAAERKPAAQPVAAVIEDDPEVAAEKDAYVQQVKSIFGGRVLKVDTSLASANRKD